MTHIFFRANKNTYKANLHCHTTISDGKLSPEEIKSIYQSKGYQIVAFTDHDTFITHNDLTDDTFLAINGFEVAINQTSTIKHSSHLKTYHFNALATRPHQQDVPSLPVMAYDDIKEINAYIDRLNKTGFLVCYNHPWWSLQTFNDYAYLEGIFAMEIYNHNCQVEDGFCGYNPQVYDEMLRNNQRIFALSTDDNHNAHPVTSPYYDAFGGWVMISSLSLVYEDVISALTAGDFYATQGPDIYLIAIEDNHLIIECSPCKEIKVYTEGRKCYTLFGENLTKATFKLEEFTTYFRVNITDRNKNEANSNGYFL